jgi:hypothetical protein
VTREFHFAKAQPYLGHEDERYAAFIFAARILLTLPNATILALAPLEPHGEFGHIRQRDGGAVRQLKAGRPEVKCVPFSLL